MNSALPYADHPMLQENYRPVDQELYNQDLEVIGEIPAELQGTLYRNGPNPQFPPLGADHHWFFSEGMIHAVQVKDGKVSYRNRWVRTEQFNAQEKAGERLISTASPAPANGLNPHFANTNAIVLGGKLFAFEEFNLPMLLDPGTLQTEKLWDADGKYQGPFTAHPKIDPHTGHLLGFGYQASGFGTPTIQYNELDTNGVLIRNERFEAPFTSVVHDFAITAKHLIFPIFPATISIERAMAGGSALAWEPEKGTFIGIVGRNESVDKIRWFKGDPCYSYHVQNAFTVEDNGQEKVILDLFKFHAIPLFPDWKGENFVPWLSDDVRGGQLVRFEFDLCEGNESYTEEVLSDFLGEFPVVDGRYTGEPYRHGYYVSQQGAFYPGSFFDTLVHINVETGEKKFYTPESRSYFHEPLFVPRSPESAEGDGWLVTVMYVKSEAASYFAVFDAEDVAKGPIAKVKLPQRVPYGFHGSWHPEV